MNWIRVEKCKKCGHEVHGNRTKLQYKNEKRKGWLFECFCGYRFFRARSYSK